MLLSQLEQISAAQFASPNIYCTCVLPSKPCLETRWCLLWGWITCVLTVSDLVMYPDNVIASTSVINARCLTPPSFMMIHGSFKRSYLLLKLPLLPLQQNLLHLMYQLGSTYPTHSWWLAKLGSKHQMFFNSSIKAWALLDSESTSSFVSECVVQSLGISRHAQHLTISGIGGVSHKSSHTFVSTFEISSLCSSNAKYMITAIIVPHITCDLPLQHVYDSHKWDYLSNNHSRRSWFCYARKDWSPIRCICVLWCTAAWLVVWTTQHSYCLPNTLWMGPHRKNSISLTLSLLNCHFSSYCCGFWRWHTSYALGDRGKPQRSCESLPRRTHSHEPLQGKSLSVWVWQIYCLSPQKLSIQAVRRIQITGSPKILLTRMLTVCPRTVPRICNGNERIL